jgi:putative transposase
LAGSTAFIEQVASPFVSDLCPSFVRPALSGERPKVKEVSRKIRLYPTEGKWDRFLMAGRRAYNLAIEAFKERREEADKQADFRRAIREQVAQEFPEAPRVLLDEAVNSAYLTRQAVIERRMRGESCDFSYRSRKDTKQSFVVERLARGGPFPTFLKCHLTEEIPQEALGKMAVVVREHGRWSLICKINVKVAAESQGKKTVACDPGVRTFISAYSPSVCAFIGHGFAAKMRPMLLQLDKLLGRRKCLSNIKEWNQGHKDRARNLEKRIDSIFNKLQDVTDDLHRRAADYLTKNFDVILLPSFETSEMTSKQKRKITSRTVRSMLSLGHYRFKQFLIWSAYKRGKTVVDCSEAWTSRTDSRNGVIVDLGPKEWINGLHRDVNGPRGIFLRALAA